MGKVGLDAAMRFSSFDTPAVPRGLIAKLNLLPRGMIAAVLLLGIVGVAFLYSAGNLNWQPWAGPQAVRLIPCLALMLVLGLVDIRVYMRYAYGLYGLALALLLLTQFGGVTGKGAQRWLDLGLIAIQPSELMKIALVLALARYFHGRSWEEVGKLRVLLAPLLLTLVPVGLVLLQPNLGTALLLLGAAAAIFFATGVRWWKFVAIIAAALIALPLIYKFGLHDYQRGRINTFLQPDLDPRGAGYNILQSQIALGSGGVTGKGFGLGTQSQLQFLPEKHTDFIFVVLAEEMGLIGALALLCLYAVVIGYALVIALTSRNDFGRLVGFGLMATIFLYVMVNVAMVSGLIPVVGIPLPLVSYGGTAQLALCTACGILLSVALHRDVRLSRSGLGWM